MSKIDKMAEQFNSPEELQAYSEAQYKTILDLNSKLSNATEEIQKLRNENAKLKAEQTILKASQPVSAEDKYKVTDEESICIMQLALLKEHSLTRELIMDEVKRLEILTKTLNLIRSKGDDKPKAKDTSKMSTEELMAWAEESLKEKQ